MPCSSEAADFMQSDCLDAWSIWPINSFPDSTFYFCDAISRDRSIDIIGTGDQKLVALTNRQIS